MNLLNLLQSEAVARGILEPGTEIDAAGAFALVRDMPYKRASSREPEATIREWRGTCSGKHYLLKALFAELGLQSRLIACTTESVVNPEEAEGKLRLVLEESGGRVVDIHNYLVVETPEGDTIVDATWPLAMKKLGFIVNEAFVPGEDQQLAGPAIENWVVPEDRDPQEYKDELLKEHFTPDELEHRDRFIRALSEALVEATDGRQ